MTAPIKDITVAGVTREINPASHQEGFRVVLWLHDDVGNRHEFVTYMASGNDDLNAAGETAKKVLQSIAASLTQTSAEQPETSEAGPEVTPQRIRTRGGGTGGGWMAS